MALRFFLLLLLTASTFLSSAQKGTNRLATKNKKALAAYQQSENYLVRRQYGPVIELMQQALERDEDFLEARIRLATTLKLVGQSPQALEQLKIASQHRYAPAELQFTLGETYWQLGRYAEAEAAISQYLTSGQRSRPMQAAANHILQSISFARGQLKNPAQINPQVLPPPINQFPLQYFPVLTADGKTLLYTRREGYGPSEDEDLVVSEFNGSGWSEPTSLSDSINSQNNEGTCTISADGRTLIFTSCQGRRSYGSCDLYVSYKAGESWSQPRNLGSPVNSRYWESQPSLSADGRTLYFVSDRPGGRGKTDIYVTFKKEDNSWGPPTNLGGTINTRGDEVSPFIHANGQSLYFASNGHVGMGGYDIFLSERENGAWAEPRNLGYPINTHQDQVSLYVSADGQQAYYSVEELKNGRLYSSELYSLNLPPAAQVSKFTTYVTGRVLNATTKDAIEAKVNLYLTQNDSLLGAVSSDQINGEYLMVLPSGGQYGLYVDKAGYLFKSLKFEVPAQSSEPNQVDILLSPIEAGAATELSNIFFETAQYILQPESKTELQQVVRFLEKNPTVSIEIGGHTDNVGGNSYNQQLSENRARAVRQYLINQSIDPQRLKVVGYGYSQPRASNESDLGRQQNRRIEIRIL